MAGAPHKFTLKILLDGEVRRLKDWPQGESKEATFSALQCAICGVYDLKLEQDQVLSLKYEDDDGDLCTLVEASLPDALSFASQRGVLRITAACNMKPQSSEPGNRENDDPYLFGSGDIEGVQGATPEAEAPASPSLADSFAGVSHQASERLSEAYRASTEHLEMARPHIVDGFVHFRQQIVDDFQSTSEDMKEAFGASAEQYSGLRPVRTVVGATAGVISAVRLAPVRMTRLAAHSVAAIAKADAPCAQTAENEETDTANESADGDASASSSEFSHFKQQVKNDFFSARDDLSTAFKCILGNASSAHSESTDSTIQTPASTEAGSEQEPQPQEESTGTRIKALTCVVPTIVSTVVGGSVAVCLLPLRATRFAVANLASRAAPGDAAEHSEEQQPSQEDTQASEFSS